MSDMSYQEKCEQQDHAIVVSRLLRHISSTTLVQVLQQ